MERKKKILIFLLIILLLGLFLRVYRINSSSLWYDEVVYMKVSKNFFNYLPYYIFYKDGYYKDLLSPLYNQYTYNNLGIGAPLYHPIENTWIKILGDSEIALRSLSVLFAILSILVIFKLARYLFNDKIGLLSAFLFAINPYNIFFSQDATYYTLVVLLSLLSVFFFFKSLKENKKKHWIFYAIFSSLGIYTHYFPIFLIFFQWIFFILLIKKHKHLIKNFILSQILIFILYLPFLPHFYYQNLYASQYFWLDVFSWFDVPAVLVVFGIGQTLIRKQSSLYLILPVLFFYFIGFIIPFLIGLFKKINKKNIFLFLYLFIPIITPAILSSISIPMFQWKYVMLASPAFYILIAKGLANVKKTAYYLFLGIIIILSFLSLIHYYTVPIFQEDWRAATSFIEKNSKDGDLIIIHSPQVIHPFKYYYEGNLPIKWFPYISFEELNEENIKVTEKNIDEIDSVIKGYKRVWLIQRFVKGKEEAIPDYLDKKYKRLYFNKFVWVRVYLYQLD